jgi:hypothetical protein
LRSNYTGYNIFIAVHLPGSCQYVASFQCYTDYIIYRSVYAKILAVCGLVLLMAAAMFQRYTDYLILSQRVCQDPGGMWPGLVIAVAMFQC